MARLHRIVLRRDTYRCIVIPHPRRSLTRRTLLITSRPRLSNTRIFHMGSPSSLSMGVDFGTSPLVSLLDSDPVASWLRFKIFSIEAGNCNVRSPFRQSSAQGFILTDLAISQRLCWGDHCVSSARDGPSASMFESSECSCGNRHGRSWRATPQRGFFNCIGSCQQSIVPGTSLPR